MSTKFARAAVWSQDLGFLGLDAIKHWESSHLHSLLSVSFQFCACDHWTSFPSWILRFSINLRNNPNKWSRFVFLIRTHLFGLFREINWESQDSRGKWCPVIASAELEGNWKQGVQVAWLSMLYCIKTKKTQILRSNSCSCKLSTQDFIFTEEEKADSMKQKSEYWKF